MQAKLIQKFIQMCLSKICENLCVCKFHYASFNGHWRWEFDKFLFQCKLLQSCNKFFFPLPILQGRNGRVGAALHKGSGKFLIQQLFNPKFIHFCLRRWGSVLPYLRTRDPPLCPSSKIFCRVTFTDSKKEYPKIPTPTTISSNLAKLGDG